MRTTHVDPPPSSVGLSAASVARCGGGDIGRSGCFSPPTPVLAARDDNDNDKDGRIMVEEMREKTRRGQ